MSAPCFLSNDEIQALQEMQKVRWSGLYVPSNLLDGFKNPEDPNNSIYCMCYPLMKALDGREFGTYALDSRIEKLLEVTRLGVHVEEPGYAEKHRKIKCVTLKNYPDNLQLGKFFGVYNKLFIVRTVSDEYYVFDGPQYEIHLDEHLLIENPQGDQMLISVSMGPDMVYITTDSLVIEKVLAEPGSVIPVDDLPIQTEEKPSLKKRLQKIFK